MIFSHSQFVENQEWHPLLSHDFSLACLVNGLLYFFTAIFCSGGKGLTHIDSCDPKTVCFIDMPGASVITGYTKPDLVETFIP